MFQLHVQLYQCAVAADGNFRLHPFVLAALPSVLKVLHIRQVVTVKKIRDVSDINQVPEITIRDKSKYGVSIDDVDDKYCRSQVGTNHGRKPAPSRASNDALSLL